MAAGHPQTMKMTSPLTPSLSRQGRGKSIRGINLNPLPLDGGGLRWGWTWHVPPHPTLSRKGRGDNLGIF